jgi:sigma-B regulation protein RsbU (phosphoserine phosphatase)
MLHALMSTLREELAMTEMFISGFYAAIDPSANELRYSNTGHPHAFLLAHDQDFERLAASDPPIGMDERRPATARRDWASGSDLLVLFTDGLSDACNPAGERLGEEPVLDVIRQHRHEAPAEILKHVFELLDAYILTAPRLDDLTMVLLRT